MSQHDFAFVVRQAMQVAMAVSEEVNNNTSFGRQFGLKSEQEIRPVLLSYSSPAEKGEVVFRFMGGLVVRVYLFDLSTLDPYWVQNPETWVCYQVDIRYYKRDPKSCRKVSSEKTHETWNGEKLNALKELRRWHHPHVALKEGIEGDVGIFVDRMDRSGFVFVDPDVNEVDHSVIEGRVPYSILIDGDLERAKVVAKVRLAEIMKLFFADVG